MGMQRYKYITVLVATAFVIVAIGLPVSGAEPADIKSLESIQSQAELDKVVAALDAELFDAYNNCDLKTYGSLLTDDLEFYDDQGD
jgi:hypothetical protein